MSEAGVEGTKGYAEQAATLFEKYGSVSFEQKHQAVIEFFPSLPCRVLDIGAGPGFDAAWFAGQHCNVVAVEPVLEFQKLARAAHQSERIHWLQDSLPALSQVLRLDQKFDVIMLTAVWMHLSQASRQTAMSVLVSLLSPEGIIAMSLRHGPVPEGRAMFDVSREETEALAKQCGLQTLLSVEQESQRQENRDAGIRWSRLVLSH